MVINLSSQMTKSLALRPCEIYMDSGLQFHVSEVTKTVYSEDNNCKQLRLVDDAEHNLLNIIIITLLLMLHREHVDPQYKTVIVWLPGTDTSGSVLSLLWVSRGAEA